MIRRLRQDILEISQTGTKMEQLKQRNHMMNMMRKVLIQIGFSLTQRSKKKSFGVTLCMMNKNSEIALFTKKSKNNKELLTRKRKRLRKLLPKE
jgi:aspartate aminotransferase-like enzyme